MQTIMQTAPGFLLSATSGAGRPRRRALAEMYIQGGSTRKVKAITEKALRTQLLSVHPLSDPQGAGRDPVPVCQPRTGEVLRL